MVENGTTLEPQKRVVLLGASNVARGIATAVETARQTCGEPVEVLAAIGHGRSYCLTTWFLGRQLPSISECGLWPALERRAPRPSHALITDIGNDILYGVPVETILYWVSHCIDRLAAHECRVVLTGLPLENLGKLSALKFGLLRSCFFPLSRVTFEQTVEAARQLDARLAALAAERNLLFLKPRGAWYGWDPIHYKLRFYGSVWQAMLGPLFTDSQHETVARTSFARWLQLARMKPEHQVCFGRAQHCAQPAGRLRDGSTLSFF